tara:strand:+ start:62 stop:268 length:207 start_codon:yes stop_codon:yes gene_type:complete
VPQFVCISIYKITFCGTLWDTFCDIKKYISIYVSRLQSWLKRTVEVAVTVQSEGFKKEMENEGINEVM